MKPLSSQIREMNTQRRSQRVLINVRVTVILSPAGKKPTSEETSTLVVNAHGALVVLVMKVAMGDLLTLGNTQTGEQQPCRVVYLGPTEANLQEIGIEFVTPSPLFWRIAFPPPDWTPRSEDAKGLKKTSGLPNEPSPKE
jgi:hypothetical protein